MPANNLGDFITKFTTRLDKVIMQETVTGDLNMNQDLLGEMSGNGTIKIAKMDMDGLATHVRGRGFTKGGISLEWEDYKLRYERDREFSIDVLDDEERAKLVSARAMGEFARTKVVPEVDALRFAELAKQAGNTVQADLAEADATAKAVLDAEQCMEDHGAKLSECLFYHSGNVKKLLRLSGAYRLSAGQAPNTNFATWDEMKMVGVAADRFYSAIKLFDGTTSGEEKGGYEKAADGKKLNFIVMHPEAAAAISKHEKLRYFSPDVNQADEAHKWQYRLFHDLLVYLQKNGLIYAHVGKTE